MLKHVKTGAKIRDTSEAGSQWKKHGMSCRVTGSRRFADRYKSIVHYRSGEVSKEEGLHKPCCTWHVAALHYFALFCNIHGLIAL